MSTLRHDGRISLLFLGGAKRVTMARMFKAAAAQRGLDCAIHAYELDAHSAIAAEGDVTEGLRWSDPAILADLDRLVEGHGIDIIIPFVDSAVGVAADFAASNATSDVFAPVSSRQQADCMFDKIAAAELFERHGLPIPPTWRQGAPCGHLIAKPRFGSASKGLENIDSLRDLYRIIGAGHDKYLIQQRFDNREEITVDCYVGMRSGQIAAVSPRLRGEVSGGEVVRTETLADAEIDTLVRRTLVATGLRGAVTVQLLRDLDTGHLMIMEINPRLGGGAVASVYAGVDLPGLIIADCLGEALPVQHATPGVETVRYLADVVFYPEQK